jgi:hypothetical protein
VCWCTDFAFGSRIYHGKEGGIRQWIRRTYHYLISGTIGTPTGFKRFRVAKKEPWGANNKVLELYLRANFEIAKGQGKVYEDQDKGVAFWRAGCLVNETSDPIWLVYQANRKEQQPWYFKEVRTGEPPEGKPGSDFDLRYDPPDFHKEWQIHFDQSSIQHILKERRNKKRLEELFKNALGTDLNEHLFFRAIYGEIQLKRKEEIVLPQWYLGDYKFLMPLFITQADNVELTAALVPDPPMKRYLVKTLLLPHFSYAYARAVVKSRAHFMAWMLLSEGELEKAGPDEDVSEG